MKFLNKKGFFSQFKKNKRHYQMSALLFLAFVIIAIVPVAYYATASITALQTAAIQEKNSAIETAILNNDYTSWANLETDTNLKNQINSSNFSQFTEAFRLLQQGKIEEVNIIKKSISLKADFQEAVIKSDLISAAIADDDYAQWRELVGESFQTDINDVNFHAYADSYRLIMEGKLKQSNYIKIRTGIKADPGTSSSR